MNGKKLLRTALAVLAAAAGVWLFGALLLPLLAPFFIGLAVAALAKTPVQLLERHGLPRNAASFLCVLTLFAALGAGIYILCRLLCGELSGLVRQLPQLAQALAAPLARLEAWLYSIADRLPDGLGTGLRSGIDALFRSGSLLGSKLYSWLFSFASGFLQKAPGVFLFLLTSILASFMLSGDWPALRALCLRRVPAAWREKLAVWRGHLRRTLGHWLRAQAKLLAIIFLVLTAGLLLLNVSYPLLLALLIALVDALPVFGTGTVLIPWGLICFLHGQTQRGVGFLVLYGAAALTRQALEPRLLGRQVGLPPILALLALYTGFRLLGVGGMILFPLAAIFLKQLLSGHDAQSA